MTIDQSPAKASTSNVPVAAISFKPDGTIRRVNDAALLLLNYNRGDLVGRHRDVLLTAADLAAPATRLEWTAGTYAFEDARRVRKDGAEIWTKVARCPVFGRDGRVREIVELLTDISAQKYGAADSQGQVEAINRSQAVVHFASDGRIMSANERFLSAMGYTIDEVAGRHHRMFVDPAEAQSAEYREFWRQLAEGRHHSAEYKRIGKDGRKVWLQATYNPIFDDGGKLLKIVKYAVDVTAERLRNADYEGQIAAIHKSQGVITFDLNGIIVDANTTFLDAMGYRLDEICGRHHRMFVDPAHAHSNDYARFWSRLAAGHFQGGEFKRIKKDGSQVWLQATYNPIFDLDGQPYKVVKYATIKTWEKLREADHQGQIAAIHKAQCVISFNLDGTIVDANDNFLDAMGYRLSAVRGQHHSMFVDPDYADSAEYAVFWATLAKGQHQSGEFKRRAKDGREVWLQATYNPIFDMNGQPFKVVKYAIDVTRERLQTAEYEGQVSAIHKSQCVVAFDMNGRVLEANANFLAAAGYQFDEIKGRDQRIFVGPDDNKDEDYEAFWNTLRAGSFVSGRYKRVGKNGREIWFQATYNPILDLNGKPFKIVELATDVTKDVVLAENLRLATRQAQHDAATALPNRIKLASFMEAALLEPHARLAVFYMDLDRFKPINDTFGHGVGDFVLGVVADRMRRALGPDQIVARIGGDEFVIAAPDLSDDEIECFCEQLLAAIAEPIHRDGHELFVGLSIGVATAPDDATTAADLLRCADTALYRSKQNGRGTYNYFAQAKTDRLNAERALAGDMRRALMADEFYLDYQPRFDLATRTIQSVEALVRWSHPELGIINPTDFIPLAEKSGVIVPLGEWVLRTACRTVMDWSGIGISVNVSPVQFIGNNLADKVRAVLGETGLRPDRLELEVTEGFLLGDEDKAKVALEALKDCGVRLAMDDFGTGYSSLGYLRDFPFDSVKIDRRFVADMESREGGRAIVQAILQLAKALGLSVTAEGVETPGQLLMLRLDNCAEVQGFLLAPPMSPSAISELLARPVPMLAESA